MARHDILDLLRRERRVARHLESELAWDERLRAAVVERSPLLPDGSRAPVTLVDWPRAPESMAAAIALWEEIPEAVDSWLGSGWPHGLDPASDAALWLLVARSDRRNDRRSDWLERISTEPSDVHAFAHAADRTHWLAHGTQLYGTLSRWRSDGSRPAVPIAEPEALAARRAALGLEPLERDQERRVTSLVIVRGLGRRAGVDAAAA